MTPRRRLLLLLALPLPAFALAAWLPSLVSLGVLWNLVVLALAISDALLTPRTRTITVSREAPEVLSVGARNVVTLRVLGRSMRPLDIELTDEPPMPSNSTGLPASFRLVPGREKTVSYAIEPLRRGPATFDAVHMRYASVLGLWTFAERRPLTTAVRVFPDIRAVSGFELLALRNRVEESGIRHFRQRGRGGEFDRLREYRREDEQRHIDWKATSKYRRLISREYTTERNQNIVILLDCGRSMMNETSGVSHLDFAINTTTILAHVALRQGDYVSVIAFSDRIERHIGPWRGRPALARIVRSLYDLETRSGVSDYERAWQEVTRQHRKRSLVVLLTHAIDEEHFRVISSLLGVVRRTHLIVCGFIENGPLRRLANRVPADDIEAFETAGAAELLLEEARGIEALRERSALAISVPPDELSTAVISRYLEIKAGNRL
jgi:uncharacterized protein (DUF58 family)